MVFRRGKQDGGGGLEGKREFGEGLGQGAVRWRIGEREGKKRIGGMGESRGGRGEVCREGKGRLRGNTSWKRRQWQFSNWG